jgi:ubiquitin carboxyl-terminal hydrolase 34
LEAFENPIESKLPELLNPSSPQHLMYSLHIVDKLSGASDATPSFPKRLPYKNIPDNIATCNTSSETTVPWSQSFIKNGGLKHLYNILMSGVLQNKDGEDNEWQQDCLILLLKLIGHLGTTHDEPARPSENLTISKLHESLLGLMDVEATTRRLMSILSEAAQPKDPSLVKTGLWGRAQVYNLIRF